MTWPSTFQLLAGGQYSGLAKWVDNLRDVDVFQAVLIVCAKEGVFYGCIEGSTPVGGVKLSIGLVGSSTYARPAAIMSINQ